jgi:hypothetical protein
MEPRINYKPDMAIVYESSAGSPREMLNYLGAKLNINLNNQVNANPNSSVGSLLLSLRPTHLPTRSWIRMPGVDVTLSGAEYDFVPNEIDLYLPRVGMVLPVAF